MTPVGDDEDSDLSRCPQIGELPYLLTLAGHGFYWFRLVAAELTISEQSIRSAL